MKSLDFKNLDRDKIKVDLDRRENGLDAKDVLDLDWSPHRDPQAYSNPKKLVLIVMNFFLIYHKNVKSDLEQHLPLVSGMLFADSDLVFRFRIRKDSVEQNVDRGSAEVSSEERVSRIFEAQKRNLEL